MNLRVEIGEERARHHGVAVGLESAVRGIEMEADGDTGWGDEEQVATCSLPSAEARAVAGEQSSAVAAFGVARERLADSQRRQALELLSLHREIDAKRRVASQHGEEAASRRERELRRAREASVEASRHVEVSLAPLRGEDRRVRSAIEKAVRDIGAYDAWSLILEE